MEQAEIRHNFAKNLTTLRKGHNLSQKQLGDKISYSFKNISKWENEETIPDIYTLKEIANLFNVSIDDLISDKSDILHKSFKKHNHFFITFVSSLLPYVLATIIFTILIFNGYKNSYYAFLGGAIVSAITFIVFSGIYYSKIVLQIAIIYLILALDLLVMFLVNFQMFYLFIVGGLLISGLIIIFFRIKFKSSPKEETLNK